MTITGPQVRAARLLLGWTRSGLGAQAGVSSSIIEHFEAGKLRLSVLIVSTIQRALEAAGVEFPEGEPGARLKRSRDPLRWVIAIAALAVAALALALLGWLLWPLWPR